jgi:hypothetical protein
MGVFRRCLMMVLLFQKNTPHAQGNGNITMPYLKLRNDDGLKMSRRLFDVDTTPKPSIHNTALVFLEIEDTGNEVRGTLLYHITFYIVELTSNSRMCYCCCCCYYFYYFYFYFYHHFTKMVWFNTHRFIEMY